MREHPRRRRLQVIRPATPEDALAAMAGPVTEEFPPVPPEDALAAVEALPLEPADDVSRETSEPTPSLSRAQVLRLEALTAVWHRQVRDDGPPDATMMYASPALPPVPPPARPAEDRQPPVEAPPVAEEPAGVPPYTRVVDEAWEVRGEVRGRLAEMLDGVMPTEEEVPASVDAHALEEARRRLQDPPRRVHDWVSRHDPASLEYAVRDRLRAPIPLQDLVLEHGPILDQGTTPPLTVREASGCVGMAVVAAANVLDASTRTPYDRLDPATFRFEEKAARRIYARAQELDHVSGSDYAGTSVLAGMKAGQEAGYWDTYLWNLNGTRDIAQSLLQLHSPVVAGLPWDAGLEEPDRDGVIAPGGAPAGGHAVAVIGLQRTVAGRAGWWFVIQQSRGEDEGRGGLVYLHHSHLARLLAGRGEAATPVPRWYPM